MFGLLYLVPPPHPSYLSVISSYLYLLYFEFLVFLHHRRLHHFGHIAPNGELIKSRVPSHADGSWQECGHCCILLISAVVPRFLWLLLLPSFGNPRVSCLCCCRLVPKMARSTHGSRCRCLHKQEASFTSRGPNSPYSGIVFPTMPNRWSRHKGGQSLWKLWAICVCSGPCPFLHGNVLEKIRRF